MYQDQNCNCSGLGFVTEALDIAKTLFGGGGGGASPAVQSQITAQVSPQISPVFQQQFQPSNSPATAGTSQVVPSIDAGGYPGVSSPIGYAPPTVSQTPINSMAQYERYLPYVFGGLAMVVLYKTFKRSA